MLIIYIILGSVHRSEIKKKNIIAFYTACLTGQSGWINMAVMAIIALEAGSIDLKIICASRGDNWIFMNSHSSTSAEKN